MPIVTILYGLALVVLGVAAYLWTGRASVTALIPAFLGLPVLILGLLAAVRPRGRRHLMHAAAALAVLGVAGTAGGIGKSLTLLRGGQVDRPEAAVVQAMMAVLSLVFILVCVVSFIRARRRR